MNGKPGVLSICLLLLGVFVSCETASGEDLWWQRGADAWCYKDDWKGLKVTGASPFKLEMETPAGAVGGWIVLWGEDDCRLYINDQLVDRDLDSCLIWDYDLAPFLEAGPQRVTLRLEARAACAEGEIISRDGIVHRFATNGNWLDRNGKPVKTEKMRTARSSDAGDDHDRTISRTPREHALGESGGNAWPRWAGLSGGCGRVDAPGHIG